MVDMVMVFMMVIITVTIMVEIIQIIQKLVTLEMVIVKHQMFVAQQ
jgi:hypothetical protein